MATYNPNHSSILDTPSGHIGPVIFYTWKNISCVRTMPQHYHDARTREQLQNRSKLSILMAFQSKMKAAIKNGFQYQTDRTTELNEATRINFHTALTTQGTTAQLHYTHAYLSWGTLPRLANIRYLTHGNQLIISWDPQTPFDPNDHIQAALYNETQQQALYLPHIATRRDLSATVTIPTAWQDSQLHIWLWINGKSQNSTSQYLGSIAPTPQHHPNQPFIPPYHHTQPPSQTQPPQTDNSQGPKCYQTPQSLGPDTSPKATPAPPLSPPKPPTTHP